MNQKLTNFESIILANESADVNPAVVRSLLTALSSSNLLRIKIKGSSNGLRLNDAHVIGLTESIVKANIQLLELSLTYHLITGIVFLFKIYL